MNRLQRRASQANGRKMMAGGWNAFEDFTAEAMQTVSAKAAVERGYKPPAQVWKNNLYVVQVWEPRETWMGALTKLGVRRNDGGIVRSWSDMQRIKNEILGPERVAMEFYPAESALTDVANMYWLWALPEGVPAPVSLRK